MIKAGEDRRYSAIYAIFEGGGAKGITHAGALKALEEEGYALVGAAGTSAGAIVAALAAAGYKADEVFTEARDILSDHGQTPLDLLGRQNWKRLGRLRRTGKRLGWSFVAFIVSVSIFVALTFLSPPAVSRVAFYLMAAAFAACVASLLSLAWAPWRIWRRNGLFDTDAMRDILNKLLRIKLEQHYASMGRKDPVPELIRFKHLDPTEVPKCCRLKIVSTDSRASKMVLFDHNTPDVVVADAVAASAAIPFLFSPPKVRGHVADSEPRFVDGGLISNLPAWSFKAEKRALERKDNLPPIPVFAFTLDAPASDDSRRAGATGPLRRFGEIWVFMQEVAWTGIFGSQAVVQGFIDELCIFALPSPLSTLAFDCTRDKANEAYRVGLVEAGRALRIRQFTDRLTRASLESILGDIEAIIAQRRTSDGRPLPHLRVSVVDPVDQRASSFKVSASSNMELDADDRLELDLRNDIAPKCFAARVPGYGLVQNRSPQELWMTKYERALVHPSLCSVICVPVFADSLTEDARRPPPQRVLCLDSSDLLEGEFNDPIFMQELVGASVATSPSLIAQQIEGLL